ncbi:hypothetical protein [Oceanicaulis sp.]|uniref:hypothetical protein n=1 Tax=Oceanicaulis sp. TaxID=1924941 RepID=UPI003BACEDD0
MFVRLCLVLQFALIAVGPASARELPTRLACSVDGGATSAGAVTFIETLEQATIIVLPQMNEMYLLTRFDNAAEPADLLGRGPWISDLEYTPAGPGNASHFWNKYSPTEHGAFHPFLAEFVLTPQPDGFRFSLYTTRIGGMVMGTCE